MPCEVKAVSLAGHRQGEGESIMIHHIVSHIVELCVKACVWTEDIKFYFMRTGLEMTFFPSIPNCPEFLS